MKLNERSQLARKSGKGELFGFIGRLDARKVRQSYAKFFFPSEAVNS